MHKIPVRFFAQRLFFGAAVLCACATCQKQTDSVGAASPVPSPAAAAETSKSIPAAPPITGPITPASVAQDAGSFSRYLHFPKDGDSSKLQGAVQFYCDIDAAGSVEATESIVGGTDALRKAVQSALDWGHFTPATVNSHPVAVYLGGTVVFMHDNGQPVIVVSLATYDRERIGKMENYIQPQLIGGLRRALESAILGHAHGVLVGGKAEVIVQVDEKGAVTSTSGITETPPGSGLGSLLESVVKGAQFTPAYQNAKATAGGINVIANFAQ